MLFIKDFREVAIFRKFFQNNVTIIFPRNLRDGYFRRGLLLRWAMPKLRAIA